jgi:primosomal protein N' (replication factor Y)
VPVQPDVPALGRTFDYLVPAKWDDAVRVGTRVRIALHGRRVGGWVVAERSDPPAGVQLRPLAGVSGWGPPGEVIELATWAAWRWAGPVTTFLRTASPDRNVQVLPSPPAPGRTDDGGLAGPADEELRAAAREAFSQVGEPTLIRIPPATDLLPLVSEVVRLAAGPGGAVQPGPGGAVLILVPSVGWAERLTARLARRGVRVAAGWAEARAGWPVVVGTRAAAWAPIPRLAAVVVLDSADESHRQQQTPTWDAWELVAERARRDGAPCILSAACPSVVQHVRCREITVSRSLERGGWPRLTVIDRRHADPRTGLLSEELVDTARRQLDGGGRAVFVLNRTGRARLMACAACGELVRCDVCGRSVRQGDHVLHCDGCGSERPPLCAVCGSTRLKVLRPGVARIREELEALLRVPVVEVSGQTVAAGGAASAGGAVTAVAADLSGSAIVGTEAALHRVRHAALVAFLDFDQHLLAPRFTAAEEALGLLARAGRLVAGRAGANGTGGAGANGTRALPLPGVLVQTRMPDHEVLRAAALGDPALLLRAEAALRTQLSLPPSGALALVSGPSAAEFVAALAPVGGALGAAGPDDAQFPDNGPVTVSALDDDRWLLRADRTDVLCDALAATPRPRGRLRVEVDPVSV